MKSKFLIPLLAGLALLCACKGAMNKSETADSVMVESKTTTEKSPVKDTGWATPKLVKKADIRFKVKNVQQTSEQIAALTTTLNGMVVHHIINSTSADSSDIKRSDDSVMRVTLVNVTADMTVKIPPANLETFMLQVSKMGIYINSSHMDIADRSLDYLSTQLKLKNQKELADGQKNENTSPKTPDDLLAFKNNMVDQQIKNRKTNDSVKTSTVILSFYESNVITREIIANKDLSAYNPHVFKRIGMSVENGWDVFITLLVCVANAWVIFPIGFGAWMLVKYFKKKKIAEMIKS